MTARTSDRGLRFTTAAADCPQEGEGNDGRPAGFQVLASSEAPDPAFLRSEQQEYTPTPPPAGRSRAAAAAVAAGDKISKLHRIKKAQVASVSVGRDYDRLFEMIASLDRKIQAIGEIVERELGPAQREDPAAPPPPPLRHTLNQFMETCTEKLHMVTTTLNESIKEKSRKTDECSTAAKNQQHPRRPPAPPGPPQAPGLARRPKRIEPTQAENCMPRRPRNRQEGCPMRPWWQPRPHHPPLSRIRWTGPQSIGGRGQGRRRGCY